MPKSIQNVRSCEHNYDYSGVLSNLHDSNFRLVDFDADVSSITREYKELAVECQNNIVLADFQRRWEAGRKNLQLRLNRGTV